MLCLFCSKCGFTVPSEELDKYGYCIECHERYVCKKCGKISNNLNHDGLCGNCQK